MGLLQKIYKSIDMLGNRIKNVKVDLPNKIRKFQNSTEYVNQKDFVANKEYVDTETTYDTQLYRNNNISPTLPWYRRGIESNEGDSMKTVLDQILFAKKNPEWSKPELTNVEIEVLGTPAFHTENFAGLSINFGAEFKNSRYNKFPLYCWVQTTIIFYITIKLNDFSSTQSPRIEYRNSDGIGVRHSHNSVWSKTENGIYYARFEIPFSDLYILHQFWFVYHMTTGLTKQNNHRENIQPTQEEISRAEIVQNITDIVNRQIKWFDCFSLRVIYNPNGSKDGYSTNQNDYNITNIAHINSGKNARVIIATTMNWKKYNLGYIIFDNRWKRINSGIINGRNAGLYSGSERVQIKGLSCSIYSYMFGTFKENVKIKFFPIPVDQPL